jgi:hypothetical protein
MNPKVSLFLTGFAQVFFVVVNTYFVSKVIFMGVLVASFAISYIWSFNVKKVAFGSNADRVIYSTGAATGSVFGLATGAFIGKSLSHIF